MLNRLFLLAACLFFAQTELSAQLDSFDISSYKLPEIKRRQLDLNFSTSFNQQRDNSNQLKYLTGNGNLAPSLSTFTNTSNYQGSGSLSLSLSPSFNRNTNFSNVQGSENKSHSFSGRMDFSSMNRFFFQDQFFIETDISGSISNQTYLSQSDLNDPSGDFNSRLKDDNAYFSTSINPSLIVGKGRIEPVEDARLAVYILQDLQKLNKLVRVPTKEEILEFSALISQLKNKRYFDARLHKIEELEQIDHFLHEKGLVKDNDIAYFNAVNDNWDYSSGPSRSSGSKFYIGVTPELSYNETLSHSYNYDSVLFLTNYNKSYDINKQIGLIWTAGYEWIKPINLYWQLTYAAQIDYSSPYSTEVDKLNSSTSRYYSTIMTPTEYVSISYYPNSRTYFTGYFGLNQLFSVDHSLFQAKNSWYKTDQIYIYSAQLNLLFYYYISPQLRFSGRWGLSPRLTSDKMASTKRNSFNQSFNLSFLYSIF